MRPHLTISRKYAPYLWLTIPCPLSYIVVLASDWILIGILSALLYLATVIYIILAGIYAALLHRWPHLIKLLCSLLFCAGSTYLVFAYNYRLHFLMMWPFYAEQVHVDRHLTENWWDWGEIDTDYSFGIVYEKTPISHLPEIFKGEDECTEITRRMAKNFYLWFDCTSGYQ